VSILRPYRIILSDPIPFDWDYMESQGDVTDLQEQIFPTMQTWHVSSFIEIFLNISQASFKMLSIEVHSFMGFLNIVLKLA